MTHETKNHDDDWMDFSDERMRGAIRADHVAIGSGYSRFSVCYMCAEPWPCLLSQALERVRELETVLTELQDAGHVDAETMAQVEGGR